MAARMEFDQEQIILRLKSARDLYQLYSFDLSYEYRIIYVFRQNMILSILNVI